MSKLEKAQVELCSYNAKARWRPPLSTLAEVGHEFHQPGGTIADDASNPNHTGTPNPRSNKSCGTRLRMIQFL